MNRYYAALVPLVLLVAVAWLNLGSTASLGLKAVAESPAVTTKVFAEASSVAVENPVLALAAVTVKPGAAIAPHVHPEDVDRYHLRR
jgi:hypothetical protein